VNGPKQICRAALLAETLQYCRESHGTFRWRGRYLTSRMKPHLLAVVLLAALCAGAGCNRSDHVLLTIGTIK